MGFGPDFQYDAFLDHCSDLFGSDNVFAAAMHGVLSRSRCRDMAVLADFMGLDEDQCIFLIGDTKFNVRNMGAQKGRRMMTVSPGANRFEKNTGLSMTKKAFGLVDALRIRRGRRVHWYLEDHSDRIDEYYRDSNLRLSDRYGITF